LRMQIGTSNVNTVQMAEILAAQDSTGNVSTTVYARVNTNSAVAELPINVDRDGGGNLTLSVTSSSSTVYSYNVTEFVKS